MRKRKRSMLRLSEIFKMISDVNFKDSLQMLDKCDVLFFCHDVDRGVYLDGKAYSPLLDSVREDFESRGLKCQTIARPWSVLVGNKGYSDPIAINLNFFLALLQNKLFRIFLKDRINSNNRFVIKLYERILKIASPRLIISIGACDSMCLASRNCKVFHVELLHGIGYTFLPWMWDKKNVLNLPQGILSLDEVSAKTFSPLKKKGIDIKVIPHPFIKRFFGELKNIHPEWILNAGCDVNKRKQILFSFSWGYAGDHGEYEDLAGILTNGLFPDVLKDVVKATNNIVFWRFRFHPLQMKQERYRCLMDFMDEFVSDNDNSEWRVSSMMPFPAVSVLCDGNISMCSMSCYDAAYMGVSSLMLCPTLQAGGVFGNYFEDLVAQGYVTKKMASFEVIRDWVDCVQKKDPLLGNLLNEKMWEEAVGWMLCHSDEQKQSVQIGMTNSRD